MERRQGERRRSGQFPAGDSGGRDDGGIIAQMEGSLTGSPRSERNERRSGMDRRLEPER